MRNDSVLNTGLTSAAMRRQEAARQAKKDKKQEKRNVLTPGAEIILEWIDKELKQVMDLEYMVMNLTNENDIKSQLIARRLHANFLKELRSRANNIMREVRNV